MNLSDYLSADPYDDRTVFGQTMDDFTIAMGKGDYLFIDYVLSQNRSINRAVELGTFRGLTSLYLGLCMSLRGGSVYTFDKNGFGETKILESWIPNIVFEWCDVLDDGGKVVSRITDNTLLICDDGDKLREAIYYAPYVNGNCIMMVHDCWLGDEMQTLPGEMTSKGLTEVYYDMGRMLRSSFRVFRKGQQ